MTAYFNPASIRRAGDMVKMWNLHDYKTAQQYSTNPRKGYLSEISQDEYDCNKTRWRVLRFSWRSGNMGQGATVYGDSDPGKWEPVLFGSTIEVLWKIACAPEQR